MKALFSGAGMAVVVGLLLGGAMKPNLGAGDRPEGPQMFVGWSGVRGGTGPFDDGIGFAAYQGQMPDYVVGTDWKQAAFSPQPVFYEPQPARDYYAEAKTEPAPRYQMDYQEPAREAPVYPSMSGGKAFEAQARARDAAAHEAATPERAAADVQIDEEAPPEATGDTSRIKG